MVAQMVVSGIMLHINGYNWPAWANPAVSGVAVDISKIPTASCVRNKLATCKPTARKVGRIGKCFE